jgi:hypothetical protein
VLRRSQNGLRGRRWRQLWHGRGSGFGGLGGRAGLAGLCAFAGFAAIATATMTVTPAATSFARLGARGGRRPLGNGCSAGFDIGSRILRDPRFTRFTRLPRRALSIRIARAIAPVVSRRTAPSLALTPRLLALTRLRLALALRLALPIARLVVG